jgi:NAD(P)-dependent dehydrogenase (short-subunit alcohol dehydrogenase family)
MDLTDRTILVTGASSGIGRATSILLGELGAKLILVGRNPAGLRETSRQLGGAAHRLEPFDLAQAGTIPDWVKDLAQQEGPLAGLVHCAGLHLVRPLRFLDLEKAEQLMRVNFLAAMQLAKGFRQKGVRASSGSIVFLSSVMGSVGQPGVSVYCASKGALMALARSLALELASESIRVNCVAPGIVKTEMTAQLESSLTEEQFTAVKNLHPLGLGHAADVANAVAFLLADTGRWITGTTLVVDGGYTAH